MNNFITRTISGVVMAAIIIAAVYFSPLTLTLLAGVITLGAMLEFFKLSGNDSVAVMPTIMVGMAIIAISFLTGCQIVDSSWLLFIIPLVFYLFIKEMFRAKERPMQNITTEITALVYIALPMALLINMGLTHTNAWGGTATYNALYPLGYIFLVWTNDVGAYLVGMSIGKHRLCERLSPKKSWEGFFGGLILSVGVAYAIAGYTGGDKILWIAMSVVLVLTAVAGDLIESMFKREAGVKDSGSIIPGHGGFLDRFDAMFISIPFVFVIIKLLN